MRSGSVAPPPPGGHRTTRHRPAGGLRLPRVVWPAMVTIAVLLVAAGLLGERTKHTHSSGVAALENVTLVNGRPTEAQRTACLEDAADDGCRVLALVEGAQRYWGREVPAYTPATVTFFGNAALTPCGPADASVGSLYCPADSTVYVDVGFLAALESRLRRPVARRAVAYVLAHEIGHRVQQVRGQLDPGDGVAATLQAELQADCYAGLALRAVIGRGAPARREASALGIAFRAAAAIAAERQGKGPGTVPDALTHGGLARRLASLTAGAEAATPGACAAVVDR